MLGVEEKAAVMRVMERGILSEYQGNWSKNFYGGPEIEALEREWSQYFGVKHAIACNSNSSGLWMALNAIGTNCDDEIIVTPYSMTISASVPLHFGALPVFADIEPNYFCLDPLDVEKKITRWTKAIIVVDLFGQPYDVNAMNRVVRKKEKEFGTKIYIIEDAAQAPGAKYQDRYTGTLGDIGVFSLNRHKHIHCGEGGICVTDNDELAFKLRLSMNHAEAVVNSMNGQLISNTSESPLRAVRDAQSMVGMNLRMPELSAAIAREQLKKLDGIVKKHQEDAKHFPVEVRRDCEHSFYRYAWTGATTDEFMTCNTDWSMKRHYITPLFKMPLFKSLNYDQKQCPTVQNIDKKIVLAWQKNPY